MGKATDLKAQDDNFDDIVIYFNRTQVDEKKWVFQVKVKKSPWPLSGGLIQVDLEDVLTKFYTLFKMYTKFSRGNSKADDKQVIGRLMELQDRLYRLLPLAFRDQFPFLLQRVLEEGRGIRLVIEVKAGEQTDRWLSLPWEILFASESQAYIARSSRLLIVRRLLGVVRHTSGAMHPPFNVTHVVASPLRMPISDELQTVEEKTISKAILPGQYQLVTNPGSTEQLQQALQKQDSQIIHFLGHGSIAIREGEYIPRDYVKRGYLHFGSDDGFIQSVTGEQLHYYLGQRSGVQLIVLNSPHGSSVAAGSVALELVHSGFPYVVAMQNAISQQAVQYFTEAFYTHLQAGSQIEYAVAAGREAISRKLPLTMDWCLPVFYTNVGVADKARVIKMSERAWQGFRDSIKHWGKGILLFGSFQIIVGFALLLSGTQPPMPDYSAVFSLMPIMVFIPLLLALIVYRWGELPIPPNWSKATQRDFVVALIERVTSQITLFVLLIYFFIGLFTSLGFWALISPSIQGFLIAFATIIFCVSIGYAQTKANGLYIISDAQIKPPTVNWFDLLGSVVWFFVFLFGTLAAVKYWSHVVVYPITYIVIGLMVFGIGYFLHKEI